MPEPCLVNELCGKNGGTLAPVVPTSPRLRRTSKPRDDKGCWNYTNFSGTKLHMFFHMRRNTPVSGACL